MVCMILNKDQRDNQLFIVDLFNESEKVAESAELKNLFAQVSWFATKRQALSAAAAARPQTIFIDSDVGLQNYISLCAVKIQTPRTKIHVYEEGIGSYRTDLVPNPIKKMAFSILGVGRYFGGHFLTEKIHLFEPDSYRLKSQSPQKKTLKIDVNFSEWINKNKQLLVSIFSPGFTIRPQEYKTSATVYLSDWNIDWDLIQKHKNLNNFYIKLHPHIKKIDAKLIGYKQFIPNSLPAEVAIAMLSEQFSQVTVLHRNSSCINYISTKKITIVNLPLKL